MSTWATRLAVLALLSAALIPAAGVAAQPDVAAERARVVELDRALAAADAAAGAAAQAHNRALGRREAILVRIRITRRDIAETQHTLDASRALLEERLVDAYVRGVPEPIEVLLTSGSISDAYLLATVLERAAEADAVAVARVRERRRRLDALRSRLAAAEGAAAQELAAMDEQRKRLEAVLAVRRATLAEARRDLGRALAAERARRARVAAARRAAQEAAARAAAAAAPQGAPSNSTPAAAGPIPSGSHVFPIAAPSTFGDDWLAARGGGRYHEGIDLFANRGAPVVAVADGVLFRVGYSGISGNRLWLRDDAGTEFFYAHLDGYAPAASEGARVTRGTVIGYNGDTGDARGTPTHVHFEIHPGGGAPVRPYPIVSAWPRIG